MPLIALHRSLTTSLGIGGEGAFSGQQAKGAFSGGSQAGGRRDAQRQAHLGAVKVDCLIILAKLI